MLNIPGYEDLFERKNVAIIPKQKDEYVVVTVAQDGSGDTDNINEAIKLLPVEGGEIFVKQGEYLTAVIGSLDGRDYLRISGEGQSSKIRVGATTTWMNIDAPDNEPRRVVTFENLGFYIVAGITNLFSHSNGNASLIIKNCNIELASPANPLLYRFVNYSAGRGIIKDCRFFDGEQTILNNVNNYVFSGNYVNKGTLQLGTNNRITNNYISVDASFTNAILMSGYANHIRGNSINGAATGALVRCEDSSDFNFISNNYIFDGASDGIKLDTYNDRNIISGNICYDNGGWGIVIGDADCNNNIVTSNVLNSNTSGTLSDAGTGTSTNNNVS